MNSPLLLPILNYLELDVGLVWETEVEFLGVLSVV